MHAYCTRAAPVNRGDDVTALDSRKPGWTARLHCSRAIALSSHFPERALNCAIRNPEDRLGIHRAQSAAAASESHCTARDTDAGLGPSALCFMVPFHPRRQHDVGDWMSGDPGSSEH